MPDDRFLHRRAGHSQRVNLLTDLEYRVWTQYMLSADDFGVMRGTHHPIQNDNDHLANRPAKMVQRCIDALVKCGLIRRFEHQGKPYVFQPDWQDWQKVSYPRTTTQPMPPQGECSPATRELFLLHPGGAKRKRGEPSGNVPGTLQEDSPLMRAGAPAKRLTANGSGERQTAYGRPAPLHDTSHKKHALCGRVCLPAQLYSEFVTRRNHDNAEQEIETWALAVLTEWGDGAFRTVEPGDPWEFWKARYKEQWPAPANAKADPRRPSWAV